MLGFTAHDNILQLKRSLERTREQFAKPEDTQIKRALLRVPVTFG